jgi:hypothetical protein
MSHPDDKVAAIKRRLVPMPGCDPGEAHRTATPLEAPVPAHPYHWLSGPPLLALRTLVAMPLGVCHTHEALARERNGAAVSNGDLRTAISG